MRPRTPPIRSFALAATLMLSLAAAGAGFGQQSEPEAFLEPLPGTRAGAAELGGPGARAANVRLRSAQLPTVGSSRLTLRPFADTRFEVRVEPASDPSVGAIWLGRVEGEPASRVHLRNTANGLAGVIRSRRGIFQLLPDGAERAVVIAADGPHLPDVARPLPEDLRRAADDGGPILRAAAAAERDGDEPSRFDLLVVIERRALRELPGFRGWLKDIIRSSVVDLNVALADSGVNAFVNLQAIKRDRHPSGGSGATYAARLLRHTTNPKNRRMRRTQRMRRRFGSDLVAVIMARNEGVCGMAWVAGAREGARPADGDGAFSVTSWRCLAGGTLPHEIGHNLGAQHAHVDPTSDFLGAYDDSFGFKEPLEFRTVMAYSCDFCTAALLFSTPDVLVDGKPAGVAGSGPEAAHNARGFEQDRTTIAAWRECRRKCE